MHLSAPGFALAWESVNNKLDAPEIRMISVRCESLRLVSSSLWGRGGGPELRVGGSVPTPCIRALASAVPASSAALVQR